MCGEWEVFMAPAQQDSDVRSGAAVIKVSGCVANESWEDVTKMGRLIVGGQCDHFRDVGQSSLQLHVRFISRK